MYKENVQNDKQYWKIQYDVFPHLLLVIGFHHCLLETYIYLCNQSTDRIPFVCGDRNAARLVDLGEVY